MGTFATTTSLDTLMIGTTFDTATTSLASKAITQSESFIKSRLSSLYDVSAYDFSTATSSPPIITTICEYHSIGFMYKNMGRGGAEARERGEWYLKQALMMLEGVASGDDALLDSNGDAISVKTTRSKVQSNTEDYNETFGEDDPLNWKRDSDKITDYNNSRD